MIKNLSHVSSAVQTYSVLSFFSLLFCLLAFAGMTFFSPNGALPYPADSSMVITKNKASLDSNTFYNDLNDLANTEQVSIIKNVLNDDGKILGYLFGANKKMVGEPTRYTQDDNLLKTTTVAGNYYIIGKLSPNITGRFRDMGLQFKLIKTPIWLVAASFLTGGDLYAVSFFTLLLMSFVVTYALLVTRLKEAVIERSFGIFQRQQARRFLGAMVTIIGNFIVFGTVIASMNHYFETVQVTAFFLTLGLFFCLLSLIQIVAYTIFLWQVRVATISDIQKNKMSGKKIQVIWLFVLALSTTLLTYETVVIVKNYPTYQSQKKLVKNWRLAGNYARVWWRFLENGNSAGNSVAQNDQIRRDNQNMRKFANSISNDEVLIAKLANEQASWTGKLDIYVAGKGIEMRSVNQTVAKNTYIINPKVLALNKEIHPESQFKATSDKAVTVYIPEKYRKQIADIKLLAMRGMSNLLSEEEIDWQFVPNKQKIFLFMLESASPLSLPDSDKEDMILVTLDWRKLPKNDRTDFLIGNFTFDAMYNTRGLQKKLADHQVIQKVHHFQNVKLSLEATANDLNRQFISGMTLTVILFLLQLVVVYDFLKMQIQLNRKEIIIRTLNGLGFSRSVYRQFISLVITLSLAEYLSWFLLGSWQIILSLLGLYFLAIWLIYIGAFRKLRKNKMSILKGGDMT